MPIFDLNVTLGRTASPAGASFETPEQLLAEMQRLRIDEALVCHAIALEADVEYGNALLIEQLRGHPNLGLRRDRGFGFRGQNAGALARSFRLRWGQRPRRCHRKHSCVQGRAWQCP